MKIKKYNSKQTYFHKVSISKPGKKAHVAETEKTTSVLSYIVYFLLIIFACISVVLITRVIFLIQKSTFSSGSYTVFVHGTKPYVISYNKSAQEVTVIKVPNKKFKNRLQESLALGIPLDGEVIVRKDISPSSFLSTSNLINAALNPLLYSYKDMTVIDNVRFINAASNLQQKNMQSYTVGLTKENELKGISPSDLYLSFKDSGVINEGLSIEVINATQTNGLAGQVSHILRNIGANVISLSSSETRSSSFVKASNSSETLIRISHLLGIQPVIEPSHNSVSDIQIVIGEDFAKKVE